MTISLRVKDVLSTLRTSFHSIDIRCGVRQYSSGWLSLITGLRVSPRTVEEITRRHEDLERGVSSRDLGPFRILLEARPFSEIDGVFLALEHANLVVEGQEVKFPGQFAFGETEASIERYERLVRSWGRDEWPHLYVTAGVRTESFQQNDIRRVVRQQGWKSAESMTAHFLELNEQDIYSSNIPFFLYVEMPAQVDVHHSEKFGLEATVFAEQSLDNMTLSVVTTDWGHVPRKLPLTLISRNGTFTQYRTDPFCKDSSPENELVCTLSHNTVSVLDEVQGRIRRFMAPAEKNPLLTCLSQFWDMPTFYQLVNHPHKIESKKVEHRPQRIFQRAVATSLSLSGFEAVDLGEEEILREPFTKVQRGTLDVLAYHSISKILILGACTFNPPKNEDIESLLETEAILRRCFPDESPVKFIPIIFSGQEKAPVLHREVLILNAKGLERLTQLVKENNEDAFLRMLGMPHRDELKWP